jgi:hypothetical protein
MLFMQGCVSVGLGILEKIRSHYTSQSNASTESSGIAPNGVKTVTVYDCAMDVLQLLTLQKWEREQELIQTP